MASRDGIVWLANSSAEIAQARRVLSALKQRDVIDELGFIVLQAGFADRFYPATNTIMRRARYLVFVPAIYRYIEESGKGKGRDVERIARAMQADLRDALVAGPSRDEPGIIGAEAGGDVLRPPSGIYWRALSELRIAKEQLYEATYHSRISKGGYGRKSLKDDDGAAHSGDSESLWDPDFPTAHVIRDGTFAARTSFALTRREAVQLRERYASIKFAEEPSLLSHIVSQSIEAENAAVDVTESRFPWLVPNIRGRLQLLVDHSRRLSLFARGATLQYHQMLLQVLAAPEHGIGEAFAVWWEEARDPLTNWNLDEFLVIGGELGCIRPGDFRFLGEWVQCMRATGSARGFLQSADARAIVAAREREQRPGRSRLTSEYHRKNWRPEQDYGRSLNYQLTYRHTVGCRIAADIVEGCMRGGK